LYLEIPKKREEAYNLAVKARKALPDDPALEQILAELSYQRNELAYAVQLLRQSAKKEPLDAKSLCYLGMSQLGVNERAQGRKTLEQALQIGLPEPLATQA
jgi:Flp pilus assembly protein TadD